MYGFNDHQLGKTSEVINLETRDENRQASNIMVSQARRTLEIISRKLDPHIYDTDEFVEAVKRMVLNNSRAQVRILVFEPQTIVRHGHRLIELGLQLTTFIEFRKPDNEFSAFNESLLVADNTGYIHRDSAERYEGTLNFNDKRVSKLLADKFEDMWAHSKPDQNLKRVHL